MKTAIWLTLALAGALAVSRPAHALDCPEAGLAIGAAAAFNAGNRPNALALALAAEAERPWSSSAGDVVEAVIGDARPSVYRNAARGQFFAGLAVFVLGLSLAVAARRRRPARALVATFLVCVCLMALAEFRLATLHPVVTAESVRLRVQPDPAANTLAVVPAASVGEVRQRSDAGYLFADFDGRKGWVSGDKAIDVAAIRRACN